MLRNWIATFDCWPPICGTRSNLIDAIEGLMVVDYVAHGSDPWELRMT